MYDPANKALQVVYIPSPFANAQLFWATSTDEGVTWEEMGPLDLGFQVRYPSLDIDDNGTPYIAYVERDISANRGLFFTRDESYNAGQWRTPVLLSDTSTVSAGWTNIDVSPDGQTILIVTNDFAGDFPKDVLYTRSTDGGATWDPWPAAVVIDGEDVYNLAPVPEQRAEAASVALGRDGFAIIVALCKADTIGGTDHWGPVYVTSNDSGKTWTAPQLIPKPTGYEDYNWDSWWATIGPVVIDQNNIPHFTWQLRHPLYGRRLFEFHMEDGQWVGTPVSDIATDRWGEGEMGSIGIDRNGWLYIAYLDLANLSPETRVVMVSGSRDGGRTWTPPLQLTYEMTPWTINPELAFNVTDNLYITYVNQGWWATPSSLYLVKAPTYAVWQTLVGVEDRPSRLEGIPTSHELFQNYPNPFNPGTTIQYRLAKPGPVTLVLYNLLGQKVRTLVNKFQGVGSYQIVWDGRNDKGHQVPSGVYFCRLRVRDFVATKKMLLLR